MGRRRATRRLRVLVRSVCVRGFMRLRGVVTLTSATLKRFFDGGSYVFPSLLTRDRPMSNYTLNTALRRLGYASNEQTGHGFRTMASSGRRITRRNGFRSAAY